MLSPSHWLSRRQSARCITRLLRWQDICTSDGRDTIPSRVTYLEYLLQLFSIRRSRERSLTLKKSSWCTTQQLGNVFTSLFVKVVFPPLVTLKRKDLLSHRDESWEWRECWAEYRRPTLQCRWWISFCFCVLVTSGIQSIKERNPTKKTQSVKGFLWKTFPSPPQQMFPPFTTSLIDNLCQAYKGFGCSVTPLRPICPLVPEANQLLLYREVAQMGGVRIFKQIPDLPPAGGGFRALIMWMHLISDTRQTGGA